ncbi:ABC transporter substrate-binding protein [Nonomuraea sp. NPDC050328]|uniref:ABC transporter substrate-binding protein n=1 Tax=Nonomuraea sp. NPDC050328 TaxID=3364361 RepID=UPI0037B4A860
MEARESRRRRLVAGVLVVLLAIAGCTSGASMEPQPSPVTRVPQFVYGKTLDVITDWDPACSYSNDIAALQNIYETLTVWNPVTTSAGPRLATSWRSSADGRRWTFQLRKDVLFHTGRKLDADLVKASVERTKRAKSDAAYIWDPVEAVRVDGPLTVTFLLSYAVPFDLVVSAGYAAYIYDPAGIDPKGGKDGGSGPYKIGSWRKGETAELVLEAFDGYWGGWDDRPHYRRVLFHVSGDQSEHWRRLLRGETNFVPRLNSRQYGRATATGGVRTSRTQSFQILMLLFNTRTGPLADIRLRKALQKAIDYDGLIRALRGSVSPASGIVPRGLSGHQQGLRPSRDLKAAEQLLRRAGYGPGGRPLTLSLTYAEGDDDQQLLVTSLTRALRWLNVRLEARAMPWIEQWEQGKKGGQDIFVMYWWPDYADAYSYFGSVFRSSEQPTFNLTFAADAELDRLIDSLPVLSATDRKGAERVYAKLTGRILDDLALAAVPWVVNYQRGYSLGIQSYHDNPAYPEVVFVYDLKPSA